ncbi:MAG: helix-turn-helix domain-containing protein [Oscillospiraceae bacterium]|nr:helix-turn-helix domain-containing protein [Oscillospiraceae bacterium]
MNNIKTGTLIRELRKEKGLTQNDLANQLHITDRAVSKWERGLCAPDISLLESLAKILGVSIVELIEGEHTTQEENSNEIETATKSVIDYSQNEILRKIKEHSRKHILIAAVVLFVSILICGLLLWQHGTFFIIDKSPSPEGNAYAIVYNKGLNGKHFSAKDAISVIVDLDNDGELRSTFGDCDYQGLWWSPDGQKYVLALDNYHGDAYLELASLEHSSSRNLVAYLSMGVEATELAKYGFISESGLPEIEYQFLQWSKDSESLLIYYSFLDLNKVVHEGYFWYNYESGIVTAVLEL